MKWIAIIVLCLGSGSLLFAQDFNEEEQEALPAKLLISGSAQLFKPIAQFDESLQTYGYGGGGSVLMRLNQSIPVYIGIDLSSIRYDQASVTYLSQVDNELVEFEEETAPSIFMGHAVVRIEPPVNFFAYPYIEGLVGFKNLFTRTKVRDVELAEDGLVSNFLEEGDWAFSYGAAIGLSIPLGSYAPTIDIKCTYLLGTAADYMVRRIGVSGTPLRPVDLFEVRNSRTDLLLPQIGVTFALGN